MVTHGLVLLKEHIGKQVFYIKGTFRAPIKKRKIPCRDSAQLGEGEWRPPCEGAHRELPAEDPADTLTPRHPSPLIYRPGHPGQAIVPPSPSSRMPPQDSAGICRGRVV